MNPDFEQQAKRLIKMLELKYLNKRYRDLTIIEILPIILKRQRQIIVYCHRCGNTKQASLSNVANTGDTKTCGCIKSGNGYTKYPEYGAWEQMNSRCRNKNNTAFKHYGGRGIGVCERWRTFANFIADMGRRPAGHTLDRIDVNGNYEPKNCRWATQEQQCYNKRYKNLAGASRCTQYPKIWRARYRGKHLGTFKTEEEAHEAFVAVAGTHLSRTRLNGEKKCKPQKKISNQASRGYQTESRGVYE